MNGLIHGINDALIGKGPGLHVGTWIRGELLGIIGDHGGSWGIIGHQGHDRL